ncbi:hypothetical protein A3Q56_03114 [Intoshia linei]|uniref:Uncharacterized protein n=1 Tax=Intoshia linei TaxID=1819745 RepID=A0A177B4B4_9BILA|nr:hypothetical protein A3Q56_03114 [Intoshia linei]
MEKIVSIESAYIKNLHYNIKTVIYTNFDIIAEENHSLVRKVCLMNDFSMTYMFDNNSNNKIRSIKPLLNTVSHLISIGWELTKKTPSLYKKGVVEVTNGSTYLVKEVGSTLSNSGVLHKTLEATKVVSNKTLSLLKEIFKVSKATFQIMEENQMSSSTHTTDPIKIIDQDDDNKKMENSIAKNTK